MAVPHANESMVNLAAERVIRLIQIKRNIRHARKLSPGML
jgi:hypothetical protein